MVNSDSANVVVLEVVSLVTLREPEIGSWDIGTEVGNLKKIFLASENKSSQSKIDFL